MSILTNAQIVTALGGSVTAEDAALIAIARPLAEKAVKSFVGFDVEQATYTEFYPLRGQQSPEEPLIEGFELIGGRAVAYGYGTRNRVLTLANLPVRSVASVYENISAWDGTDVDGSWPAETLLTLGSDYQVDWESSGFNRSGFIYRKSGGWADLPRTIKVTYTAGFTAAELAVDAVGSEFYNAVLLTTIQGFNQLKSQQGFAMAAGRGQGSAGPIMSGSLGPFSVSYGSSNDAMHGLRLALPPAAAKTLEEWGHYGKRLGLS